MKKSILLLLVSIFLFQFSISQNKSTQVFILGTTHSNHLVADFHYTLNDIESIIKKIKPNLICIEITAEALGTNLEGYFPPENSAIIEFSKKYKINFLATDWRNTYTQKINKHNLSKKDQLKLKSSKEKVDQLAINYLKQNNWKNYFNFIQNNKDFHKAIKNQHSTKIDLLGEENDGFWLTRNKKISENIMASIKNNKPKTVLITIGLHHKYILEELLRKYASIKIMKIPNYKSSNNTIVDELIIKRWQKNLKHLNTLLNSNSTNKVLKNKIKQSRRIKELQNFINSKGKATLKIRHLFEKK